MGELLLVTLYSFLIAAPLAFLAGVFYFLVALFVLHFFSALEVRGGMCGFVAFVAVIFSTVLTFLVVFANLCRSF